MSERKKIPLVYVPYGILPFDDLTICQNPELVTGTKDSLCARAYTSYGSVLQFVLDFFLVRMGLQNE
jgi:hypothetical protein